jgi:hypothetical protein
MFCRKRFHPTLCEEINMANSTDDNILNPEEKEEEHQIEPLSDAALEDASGGCIMDSCSIANCSNAVQ